MIYRTPPTWKPPVGTTIDRNTPLSRGLGLCMPFNEGQGKPLDVISGTRIPLSGTCTWGVGKYGPFLQGDGSTGYAQANFPLINYASTQPQTVAMLFSDLATDATTYARVLEKGVNTEWAFVVNWGSNIPTMDWQVASGSNHLLSTTSVKNGNWWVICGTIGAAQNIYVNGVLNSTAGAFTPAASGAGNLTLFRAGGGSTNFSTAKLAGLWVWNRILTAGEISAHATNPWQMFPSPSSWYLDYLATLPYTFSAAGLAISGGPGGTGATVFASLGGRAISGAYGGTGATVFAPIGGLAISGSPAGATAGPSPAVAGLAISGGPGGTAETVTVLLAGLGIGGALGVVVAGTYSPPVVVTPSSVTISALYLQGRSAAQARAYGPVTAGMVFQGVSPTGTLFPPTSFLGPMVNAVTKPGAAQYPTGITQVATPLVPGTQYTVLSVIPDPMANPDDPGAHNTNIDNYVNDPGDQVTLSGGIGTVSALVLATALRVS